MIKRSSTLIAAAIISTACVKEAPTVVFDQWWNEDYAREACGSASGTTATCVQEQLQNVRAFETELVTQLAALPECKGIKVVGFRNPNKSSTAAAEAINKAHWTLSLNYMPDAPKQQWQMLGALPDSPLMQGTGIPTEIAKSVCAIVGGGGAAVATAA